MNKNKNIIGVVLAGGKSSRMGTNKALLDYNGKHLLDHMIERLLSTGITEVCVSGAVDGYKTIHDKAPYAGPAQAMSKIIGEFSQSDGVLFVPVDMPNISEPLLSLLMEQEEGAYFNNAPLPCFITGAGVSSSVRSVKDLLRATNTPALALPPEFETCMINTNTPEEWKAFTQT